MVRVMVIKRIVNFAEKLMIEKDIGIIEIIASDWASFAWRNFEPGPGRSRRKTRARTAGTISILLPCSGIIQEMIRR